MDSEDTALVSVLILISVILLLIGYKLGERQELRDIKGPFEEQVQIAYEEGYKDAKATCANADGFYTPQSPTDGQPGRLKQ